MLLLMLVACPGTQEDSGPPPVTDSCLPIEAGYANVEPILIEACGDCHGTEPRYGAPYSLVDGYADLVAGPPGERKTDAMLDSLMAGTMPQGSTLEHNALDTLVEWTSCGEEHAVHGPDLRDLVAEDPAEDGEADGEIADLEDRLAHDSSSAK